MILKEDELTPVEFVEGIYLKRDDLYKPFGDNTVNGGKLRQCYKLIKSIKDKYAGVITCSSIYSPQSPITAAVAKHFGLKCVIAYGGTTKYNLKRYRMPTICKNYGADIRIISKSGIHQILYRKAQTIAKKENLFIVDYGFNISKHHELLLSAISRQVENIPDDLDNLVITCGSGITTIGIMIGLNIYNKKPGNIYLVCTAPDRSQLINDTLKKYGYSAKYKRIDLFHQKGFRYEKGLTQYIGDIKLHPNYEAKSYHWIKNNLPKDEKTLLWVVGSKPLT